LENRLVPSSLDRSIFYKKQSPLQKNRYPLGVGDNLRPIGTTLMKKKEIGQEITKKEYEYELIEKILRDFKKIKTEK